jgi:hypothetical protein
LPRSALGWAAATDSVFLSADWRRKSAAKRRSAPLSDPNNAEALACTVRVDPDQLFPTIQLIAPQLIYFFALPTSSIAGTQTLSGAAISLPGASLEILMR